MDTFSTCKCGALISSIRSHCDYCTFVDRVQGKTHRELFGIFKGAPNPPSKWHVPVGTGEHTIDKRFTAQLRVQSTEAIQAPVCNWLAYRWLIELLGVHVGISREAAMRAGNRLTIHAALGLSTSYPNAPVPEPTQSCNDCVGTCAGHCAKWDSWQPKLLVEAVDPSPSNPKQPVPPQPVPHVEVYLKSCKCGATIASDRERCGRCNDRGALYKDFLVKLEALKRAATHHGSCKECQNHHGPCPYLVEAEEKMDAVAREYRRVLELTPKAK